MRPSAQAHAVEVIGFPQRLACPRIRHILNTLRGTGRRRDMSSSIRIFPGEDKTMKHSLQRLLLACLVLSGLSEARSQWSHTGPFCGCVNTLFPFRTQDGKTKILAGMSGDWVYGSTDLGESWQFLASGITGGGSDGFYCFASLEGVIFGGGYAGVYRSTDGGGSWLYSSGGLSNHFVTCLAVFQGSLFAGTWGGLYRSSDGGNSWARVDSLGNLGISSLTVSDERLFASAEYAVHITSDGGESWTTTAPEVLEPGCGPLVVRGATMILGTRYGLYKSTDNGLSWNQDSTGTACTDVPGLAPVIGDAGDTILFCRVGACGLLSSSDMGVSWQSSNNGLYDNSVSSIIACNDSSGNVIFLAGTRRIGMYRSSDFGRTWNQKNYGITCGPVTGLAMVDSSLVAGVFGTGVFRTRDNGAHWDDRTSGSRVRDPWSVIAGDSCILVGDATDGIARTTNDGNSWTSISSTSRLITSLARFTNDDGQTNIFAGTDGWGVDVSTDDGVNWNWLDHGAINSYIYCFAVAKSTMFVGTQNGVEICRYDSTGFGIVSAALTGKFVWSLLNLDEERGDTGLVAGADGDVLISTDAGTSWSDLAAGIPTGMIRCFFPSSGRDGSPIYFAGTSQGIFRFFRSGTSWESVDLGLRDGQVWSIAVSGKDLMVGADHGVWRRPLAEIITSVAPSRAQPPNAYRLYQNYPNPFNPTTTIRYDVPKESHVVLKVYNVLGQEVATLVDTEQQAGKYGVLLDGKNLASGIYFYRVQAGHFVESKKLVLLR